jgi:transcriptional regulator with XRE-family HTH domain
MDVLTETVEEMVEDPTNPVAKVVRDLMEAAGLTQDRMAAKLGVSISVVNQLLSGQANPTHATLSKLVDVFGVDPRLLFAGWMNGQREKEGA